jgi:hypothetical protein
MAGNPDTDRLQALEARLDALSGVVKGVLTTLVLRGILNRAEIPALLQETATMTGGDSNPAAKAELLSIQEDLPGYLRTAMGPAPDPDDDDH